MGQKIKLDDGEYEVEHLSDQAKAIIELLKFTTTRIEELINMQALLRRAQNSYVNSLKSEVISNKAGNLFADD